MKPNSIEHSPLLAFEPTERSRWQRFRESKHLVLAVVCVLLMLDVMLITALEPLLPLMLHELHTMENKFDWSIWAASMFNPANSSDTSMYTRYAPQIGFVLGLKPGIEVVGNLLVGPLVDRIGHKGPLLVGSLLYVLTAAAFALSPNYPILVTARALQAVSSSLSTVSGLALLASTFRVDEERSRASSIAFGAMSFGLIAGFPFGAVVAQLFGRATPFLVLSAAAGADVCLRLLVKSPPRPPLPDESRDPRLLWRMVSNRYVGSVLLADFCIHFALATVFTTVPIFMQVSLGGQLWQMATVMMVSTLAQFATQFVCTGDLTRHPLHRWRFLFPSQLVFALALLLYPMMAPTRVVWFAMLPDVTLRIAMGIFTSTCFPTLNFLVDQFFGGEYGAVNGLYTGLFNLGMFCGSLYAGHLMNLLGLSGLYHCCAAMLLLATCAGFAHRHFERDVDAACERVQQSVEDSLRYDNFGDLVHSSASGSVL